MVGVVNAQLTRDFFVFLNPFFSLPIHTHTFIYVILLKIAHTHDNNREIFTFYYRHHFKKKRKKEGSHFVRDNRKWGHYSDINIYLYLFFFMCYFGSKSGKRTRKRKKNSCVTLYWMMTTTTRREKEEQHRKRYMRHPFPLQTSRLTLPRMMRDA